MIRGLSVAMLLSLSTAVQAFTHCDTKPVAGPSAAVAEEGDNPVSWANYTYGGFVHKTQVGVFVSADSGQTIGEPVTIYSGTQPAGNLRLGVSFEHVYALWNVRTATGSDLMFAVSHDHGAAESWSAPVDLGPHASSTLSQISADARNVHVAYVGTDDVIKIRNSADSGRHFADAVSVGPGVSEVVVKSLGQNVYVAWGQMTTRADAFVGVSHDGGATFKVTNLSAERPSGSNEPIFALDSKSGRLSLVWRENSPVQGVYLQSLDNGDTWSAPLVLDAPTRQFMVVDDGKIIYISYLKVLKVDGMSDYEVFLTTSSDGGRSFAPGKNLSGVTGISMLNNDRERPLPWASQSGNGQFRLTGVEMDGVHAWNGANGHVGGGIYLGPGDTAAPVFNSVVWQGPSGTVMYGHCQ